MVARRSEFCLRGLCLDYKPARKKFKAYPIGCFHIDIAEVRTEQGKLLMLVAIDRTSKFASVELHERATTTVPANFLRSLIEAVSYKIHTGAHRQRHPRQALSEDAPTA